MSNHKACICIGVILALLIGLSPMGVYASHSTWKDFAPTKNLNITMPQSLHDFPIATDATFNPYATVTNGSEIGFSYDSNCPMDDLFGMYALYMKGSKDFIADKGDGTGTLYTVFGIKAGYEILITIGMSIDNQVTVSIRPNRK